MLRVPSAISKITTMSDGGLRLQVDTQELDARDKADVMGLHKKIGWFIFSESEITESDIPTEQVDFKNDKTPGQRLRSVLYRLWEQEQGGYKEFETYYRAKMELIINSLKEKLN